MRRLVLLAGVVPLVALALLAAAPPAPIQLPAGRTAAPITNPFTRVTVRADGTIEYEGVVVPRVAAAIVQPGLVGPLKGFVARNPDGSLLLAGDRRVDFHAVREVLASANDAGLRRLDFLTAEGAPPRAIHVEQSFAPPDPALAADLVRPGVPPLTIHLTSTYLWTSRDADDGVLLDRIGGALDLGGLAWLLEEDTRLYPGEDVVVVNTDDGVAYGDTIAVLDLTREKGYPRTLLAGGPPGGANAGAASTADPGPLPPVEAVPQVEVRPDGAMDVRGADGSLEIFPASATTRYEAHCDATDCDIVALAKGRRLFVGVRARSVPVPGWLFGKRVAVTEGRLGLPAPRKTGTFSPVVGHPFTPHDPKAPRPPGGAPILLGRLSPDQIDGVMKRNLDLVQECYGLLLGRGSKERGKVTVKFVVAADGTVSAAELKDSEIHDRAFGECLTSTVGNMVFPKPADDGIVVVTYPFVFTPG